jgi:hypothetical protein
VPSDGPEAGAPSRLESRPGPAGTLRKVLLAAIAAYAVLVIAPDTLRLVPARFLPGPQPLDRWYPLGTVGFEADNDGVVTGVDQGGPAWQACLRKGDKIDLARTNDRRAVNQIVFVSRLPVSVYVSRFNEAARDRTGPCAAGPARANPLTITPIPETLSWPEWATLLLDQLSGLAFIALCAYLAWHHFTPQTAGLFLYSVWFNSGQYFVWYANLGDAALVGFDVLQAVFEAAGLSGLLLFALTFPRDIASHGWRRHARLALPLLFVLLLYFGLAGFGNFIFGHETERLYRTYYWLNWVVYGLVFAVFADTYWSRPTERGRIKWVLGGVIVGLSCFLFADTYEATSMLNWLGESYHVSVPLAVLQFLYAVNVVVPLSIFYAVRHHRVINVRFPLTRALAVPCAIGASIVAIHLTGGAIEHFVSRRFEHIELTMGVVVAVLILLAHEPVRRGLEAVLYPGWRKREAAFEEEILRLAGRDLDSVERILIEVPVRLLGLTSGALFEKNQHGDFTIKRRFRWPENVLGTLRGDDPIVAWMEMAPTRSREADWDDHALPPDFEPPALVLPIVTRRAVKRLVLLGPHTTSEDLARDEIRLIERLGRTAAANYEAAERRGHAPTSPGRVD